MQSEQFGLDLEDIINAILYPRYGLILRLTDYEVVSSDFDVSISMYNDTDIFNISDSNFNIDFGQSYDIEHISLPESSEV